MIFLFVINMNWNFLVNVIWEKRYTRSNNSKLFGTMTEHVLCYRRSSALVTIKEPRIDSYNDELDTLTVELDNYILLSPDALPLDENNKNKLLEIEKEVIF